jgi:polyisoprenoid-binding protein YceI
MSMWIFEPGHTEAEFNARHMMITWVRGFFKGIRGSIELDLDRVPATTFSGEIDATKIWTGEPTRDEHLRSADFFDVEHHPKITFEGRAVEQTGDTQALAEVDLTIRGVTRRVPLDVTYLGQWETPFWVGDENRGNLTRAGFEATTTINRHHFGVSWQDKLPDNGVVVSNTVKVTLDVEAILVDDLARTGAIEHYRADLDQFAQPGRTSPTS